MTCLHYTVNAVDHGAGSGCKRSQGTGMCMGRVLGNWDAAQAAICSEAQLWGGTNL